MNVDVKELPKGKIRILGVVYYPEELVKQIGREEYQRGFDKGKTVHVAEIMECTICNNQK